MTKSRFSRRDVLKGSAAIAAGVYSPRRCARRRRRADAITPALIEAAKKEGKVVFYTAMDLQLARTLGPDLRAEIPRHRGTRRTLRRRARVSAHRPGISQQHPCRRRGQHRGRGALHHLEAQRLARVLSAGGRGQAFRQSATTIRTALHVTTRVLVSPFGYNTRLVKAEDAPKSFADLLDPKWAGKMVKAHPAYSGTIMNATFQIARDLGWEYFEKLAKQRIMQVQSATDTPKKISLGERAIMIDGAGYLVIQAQGGGRAGRDRSIRPKARRWRPARARCSRARPIRMPRGCSSTGCTGARPSRSWSTSPASIRRIRQTVEKPGVRRLCRYQADEGGRRKGSRRRPTRSRRATPRSSGFDPVA